MRRLVGLLLCLAASAWTGLSPARSQGPGEPRAVVVGDPEISADIILQTSPLAGFQYHAGRALFPLMRAGDRLSLWREPDNPYDPRAVRVEWRGAMIGYAPRAENVDLARLMDRGAQVEARILHLQKSRDPWRRVLIEVLLVDAGH